MNADEPVFIDANVLLYSIDAAAGSKATEAQRWLGILWQHGLARLSWQVLHEFYANATRKMRTPAPKVRTAVRLFSSWDPAEFSISLIERAWHWTDTAQLAYWDALIVAAAEAEGCRWLLTEDLQHRQTFDSVTVINPFRVSPQELGLTAPE